PNPPTPMSKNRFWKPRLLKKAGFEKFWKAVPAYHGGQMRVSPASAVVSSVEFWVDVTPADWLHDVVPPPFTQLPAGALAFGVPMLWVRTPEEPSLPWCGRVFFTILTFNASCTDMPAPSHPATL